VATVVTLPAGVAAFLRLFLRRDLLEHVLGDLEEGIGGATRRSARTGPGGGVGVKPSFWPPQRRGGNAEYALVRTTSARKEMVRCEASFTIFDMPGVRS
jgi:hypothetical protein